MTSHRSSNAPRRRANPLGPLALGAVLLLAVGLNQSAIHWRANVADSHLFEYYGWCVARGAVPYLDIWDNKPPGIWWANALAFALLGPGVMPGVVVSSAALVAALAAFIALARRAFRPSLVWPAALVAVALLTDQRFECGGNRTETYVVTFETLAMLCYVHWLRRGGGGVFWAGIFGGVAPVFKQSGVAATAAIGLHLLYLWVVSKHTRGQRAAGLSSFLALAGGFAIAPLAAAVALASRGALDDAWFAVSTFNRAYFAVDDATWTRLDRSWRHLAPAIELLTPVLILAGAGLMMGCAAWIRVLSPSLGTVLEKEGGAEDAPCTLSGAKGIRAPRPRRAVGVFVLWWVFAVYLAMVGPGRREYHLMPSLAPLALLLLYGVHQLCGRRELWRAIARSPLRATGVVAWGYVLVIFAHGNLAEIGKSWALKPAWWTLERTVPAPYEAQAEIVAALTQPDGRIYVSGWSPGTYRFAYRLPASRFATFEKVGQVGAHAQFIVDGARHDLRAAPPRVFVISISDYAGVQRDAAPEWREWLNGHYAHHSDVQGMKILVRRDDAPPFGQPPAAPLASPACRGRL